MPIYLYGDSFNQRNFSEYRGWFSLGVPQLGKQLTILYVMYCIYFEMVLLLTCLHQI